MNNVETIAGLRFCGWKGWPDPKKETFRLSATFYFVLVMLFVFIGLGAKALLREFETNVPLAMLHMQIVAIAFMVLPFAAMVAMVLSRRKSHTPLEFGLELPEGAPMDALPVLMNVLKEGSFYNRSKGWLWTDGGYLLFVGERFDMRLHFADLKLPKKGFNVSAQSHRLLLPKELGGFSIMLRPHLVDNKMATFRAASQRLKDLLGRWDKEGERGAESLFPPIWKQPTTAASRESFVQVLTLGLALGFLTWFVLLMLPADALAHRENSIPKWGLALMVGAILPIQFGAFLTSSWDAKRRIRKLIPLGLRPENLDEPPQLN